MAGRAFGSALFLCAWYHLRANGDALPDMRAALVRSHCLLESLYPCICLRLTFKILEIC